MSKYQSVENFNRGDLYGNPQYLGQEYDKNIPDDMLVGSPGGTASTFSHWTKGFYGTPSSSWDFYAGQGQAYPYGLRGNLYDYGQTAIYDMGYYNSPPDPIYSGNNSVPVNDIAQRENYEYNSGIEEIKTTPINEILDVKDSKKCPNVGLKINPVVLFVLFIVAYIAMDFWSSAGQLFIQERFNQGNPLSWKSLLAYGFAATILLFVVAWSLKVPFIEFETL
jgi:hypothetical protein